MSCGLKGIDEQIRYNGLPNDFLIYILGRSKVGKTELCLNLIHNQLREKNDRKIILFSFEVNYCLLMDSFLKIFYGESGAKVKDFLKTDISMAKLELENIDFFKRFFVYDHKISMDEMEKVIEKIKPDMVYIDHLHKIPSMQRTIFDKTTEICYWVEDAKKKFNTRIVCLVQVSRSMSENANSGSEFPRISDGKGSGAVEETGDIILSVMRPDAGPKCSHFNKNTFHALIVGNRYQSEVETRVIIQKYDRKTGRLSEIREVKNLMEIKNEGTGK